MKKIMFTMLTAFYAVNVCYSSTNKNDVASSRTEIQQVVSTQKVILKEMENLKKDAKSHTSQINHLDETNRNQGEWLDSLKALCAQLKDIQDKDRTRLNEELDATNSKVLSNYDDMKNRTMWGGAILTFFVLGFGGYLFIRCRKDSTSMDEVRKAQEALQIAQTKMQEDSIKLDNQMLILVEKQMNAVPGVATQAETDHSLALKVADEIVRIELNLSRMDASIKGYKQLKKAVERIKNNFQANGYEIVDMLGKPYVAGMKAAVAFITDNELEPNQQIITKIIKPQINYQQKMIQAAEIEVSQSE